MQEFKMPGKKSLQPWSLTGQASKILIRKYFEIWQHFLQMGK